jgi:polyribonucleotide nucleotidyltransferase
MISRVPRQKIWCSRNVQTHYFCSLGVMRHGSNSIPTRSVDLGTTSNNEHVVRHVGLRSRTNASEDRRSRGEKTKISIRMMHGDAALSAPLPHISHIDDHQDHTLSSFDNHNVLFDVARGPTVQFGTGKVAPLADGSVMAMAGHSVLLCTVMKEYEAERNNLDEMTLGEQVQHQIRQTSISDANPMVPLTVDYRERFHAVGKIPPNAKRRDNAGPPTDRELLASRAVDRSLRPVLQHPTPGDQRMPSLPSSIHVSCALQSYYHHNEDDYDNGEQSSEETRKNIDKNRAALPAEGLCGDPVALAINATTATLLQSGLITKNEIVGCVKLCVMPPETDVDVSGGSLDPMQLIVIVDPTPHQLQNSWFELLYTGRQGTKNKDDRKSVVMMELFVHNPVSSTLDKHGNGMAVGVPEFVLRPLLEEAHEQLQPIFKSLRSLARKVSNSKAETHTIESFAALKQQLGLSPSIEDESTTPSSDLLTEEATVLADTIYKTAQSFIFHHHDMLRYGVALFGHRPHLETVIDLSKKARGQREHALRSEVKRLMAQDFVPYLREQNNTEELAIYFTKNDDGNHDRALLDVMAEGLFEQLMKRSMAQASIDHGCRADGRASVNEIRPIQCNSPFLPPTVHGSAFFSRGETQVMCTTTLAAPRLGLPTQQQFDTLHDRPRSTSSKTKSRNYSETEDQNSSDDELVGSLRYTQNYAVLESDMNSRNVRASAERVGDSGDTWEQTRRFFLHYDFAPFCVGGGTGKSSSGGGRGPNRRAIGHGRLAERALWPSIPPPHLFPYAMRVTSEVTGSNGSSSMASVCGGTLALLDAGVPLLAPCAGVSVGLVVDKDREVKGGEADNTNVHILLLDLTGTEDHFGEMDFKVAGTSTGVTAAQLDVKLDGKGIPLNTLLEAFDVAKLGRHQILQTMAEQVQPPVSFNKGRTFLEYDGSPPRLVARDNPKITAPRVEVVRFHPTRKRDLVGPGGAVLRQMEERFGVSLDLSQEGQCLLYGNDAEDVEKCKMAVMDLVADVEVGGVYEGTVIMIKDFGAIVELLRNKEGILHISELTDDDEARRHPEGNFGVVKGLLRVGQKIEVLCTAVDVVQGSIKLSRRKLLQMRRSPKSTS